MFKIEALLNFKNSSKRWYYFVLYVIVVALGLVLLCTSTSTMTQKLLFIFYPQLYALPIINNSFIRYFYSIQLIVFFPILFIVSQFLSVYTQVWFLIVFYLTFEFFINNFRFYVYLLLIIYHFGAMLYVYSNYAGVDNSNLMVLGVSNFCCTLLSIGFLQFLFAFERMYLKNKCLADENKLLFEQTRLNLQVSQHSYSNFKFLMRCIVHDIRNTLQIFYGSQSAYKKQQYERAQSLLEKAQNQLNGTINSMILISKGKNFIEPKRIAISQINEMLKDYDNRIINQMNTVDESLAVWIDEFSFYNALQNLVRNALYANATKITCIWDMQQDSLNLHILDDGDGIPDEKVNSLFKEEVQSQTGSGIGLLGVKYWIQLNGATIDLVQDEISPHTHFLIKQIPFELSEKENVPIPF